MDERCHSDIPKIIRSTTDSTYNVSLPDDPQTLIPLTEHHRSYTKETTLKQGLLLCTRTEEWYTKKKTTMREVTLRKTRLTWRQFKAVLKPNKLELYHVTNNILIPIESKRLAHVIYLNNQYPFRRVRLSLESSVDYIWSLQFLHYETKSSISFCFQSTSMKQAQEWYMTIYHILPPILACKKPIPPFIDIVVVLIERRQPFTIRIPLKSILESGDTQYNLKAGDIKRVIWTLFKSQELFDCKEDLRLCWRNVDADVDSVAGDGFASTMKSNAVSLYTPVSSDNIEWISQDTELIGPQLIEQKYRLELRSSKIPEETLQKRKNFTLEGLLTQYVPSVTRKKTSFYAILYSHHIFFLDKSYYYFYQRLREHQRRQPSGTLEQNKKHHNWFSATTGGIYLQEQKKWVIGKTKKQWQHMNRSTPHLSPTHTACHRDEEEEQIEPDPFTLINTKFLIDLNQVLKVQPYLDKVFQIYFKDQRILYYQATNTQTMLEWVTLIQSKLKLDPSSLIGKHNDYEIYQSRPKNLKNILHSGLLYVKKNYKHHYEPLYCILSKNRHGGGLLLFEVIKTTNVVCIQKQRQHMNVYGRKSQLLQLDSCYIYSGDTCILDKLSTQSKESSRYYADGHISSSAPSSDCVFVIWQLQKRHFVPNFREYLSLMKLGHRLGNRGTSWVFKARDKRERDEWVWALHKEF